MTRYWFKRKRYGYGWQPSTWEGWLVTLVFLALMIAIGFHISVAEEKGAMVEEFVIPLVVLIALLVAISWRTGEPAKWQWGGKSEKEQSE